MIDRELSAAAMGDGPCGLPARVLARRLRRQQLTAAEALEAHLEQIETHNTALNAVVSLDTDRARTLAKAADAALGRGEIWGPLHGVPMTLKDGHDVAGLRTTVGTVQLDQMADQDGTVAARLRAAGAIIIGHTNVPPWLADYQSANPIFGRTANPWDTERTAGGSSGGAAAALAASMTPLEIGSDLAGSLRLPAHFCGVYGLKTTEHRVPLTGFFRPPDGVPRSVRIMSCLGPMARDLGDLQLALAIIAGPDGQDGDVPPVPFVRDVDAGSRTCAWAWRRRCPAPRSREASGSRSSGWQLRPPTPARGSRNGCPTSIGRPSTSCSAIWSGRSPACSTPRPTCATSSAHWPGISMPWNDVIALSPSGRPSSRISTGSSFPRP
jgi:Asp-tRNA(Asn)/Glu-tRNA(Gln) amidotransferase A subunit family amidase